MRKRKTIETKVASPTEKMQIGNKQTQTKTTHRFLRFSSIITSFSRPITSTYLRSISSLAFSISSFFA